MRAVARAHVNGNDQRQGTCKQLTGVAHPRQWNFLLLNVTVWRSLSSSKLSPSWSDMPSKVGLLRASPDVTCTMMIYHHLHMYPPGALHKSPGTFERAGENILPCYNSLFYSITVCRHSSIIIIADDAHTMASACFRRGAICFVVDATRPPSKGVVMSLFSYQGSFTNCPLVSGGGIPFETIPAPLPVCCSSYQATRHVHAAENV